jgi:hypothetical protein
MPQDAVDGRFRIAHLDGREVLFGDGVWRWVDISAWAEDRHGRVTFLADWVTPGDRGGHWEGWYVADEAKMREG